MSWSFNDQLTRPIDKLRLLIGDVNESDQLIQDEALLFFLTQENNYYRAAAKACLTIAARLSKMVDQSVGQVRVSLDQQFKHYVELASTYMRQADAGEGSLNGGGLDVYAGGIDKIDKQLNESDVNRVQPFFSVDFNSLTKKEDL